MLSRKPAEGEVEIVELEESGEQEGEIKWLTPRPKTRVQAALDAAKALSERVYGTLKYVAGAAGYLPHHLKGGANSAYEKAHELYTTLKPVSLSTANTLNNDHDIHVHTNTGQSPHRPSS